MIRRRRHLGTRAAALVDGELDHEARERALVHVTHCATCRAEVAEQRRLKARLRGLTDVDPDPALVGALRSAGGGRRDVVRRRPRPRHPVRLALAGGGGLVVATLGVALLAGGSPDLSGPAVTPPVDQFVVEHVATSDQLPLNDPGLAATGGVSGR